MIETNNAVISAFEPGLKIYPNSALQTKAPLEMKTGMKLSFLADHELKDVYHCFFQVPSHLFEQKEFLKSFVPNFQISNINFAALKNTNVASFCNGFQCWSESPFVAKHQRLRPESFEERKLFGDETFLSYDNTIGMSHTWSFGYLAEIQKEFLANKSNTLETSEAAKETSQVNSKETSQVNSKENQGNIFFGCVQEDLAFCCFGVNFNNQTLSINLFFEGLTFERIKEFAQNSSHGDFYTFKIASLYLPLENKKPLFEHSNIFKELIQKYLRVPRTGKLNSNIKTETLQGYTSWYLHYNSISQQILERNILSSVKSARKVFQIDDGYQSQIGDWLSFSPAFPNGVAPLAEKARKNNMTPGIWIAPFIASKHSLIFKTKPHWFLTNENFTVNSYDESKSGNINRTLKNSNMVLCGNHPLWGGEFYALNSEHPEVLEYIENVLKTFFQDFGFQFLKADFLYATALQSNSGMSRALQSARAHSWLQSVCSKYNAKLLSCGAVLSSSYNRCEYARIGPDVCEEWYNNEFYRTPSREKVSTQGTLFNTIGRAILGNVTFGNDPDVVILRKTDTKLTLSERTLLAKTNSFFGQLVFCSDERNSYEQEQSKLETNLIEFSNLRKQYGEICTIRCKISEVPAEFIEDFEVLCQHGFIRVGLSENASGCTNATFQNMEYL